MAELKAGFDHLPLGEVINRLTGVDLQLYQDQLAHAAARDAFWDPVNFRPLLADWTVPTLLVDGWHDYPLPGVVQDYAVLRASPAPVHLRIGAGGHLGGGGEGGMTDAPLDWFDTWLLGREGLLGHTPVKVHVQGEGGRWRDLPDWPPSSQSVRWYLAAAGHLTPVPPEAPSEPDRYRYDPADPTPSMGGIGMLTGGTVDNRPWRPDPTSSCTPPTSWASRSSSSVRSRRSCTWARAWTIRTSSFRVCDVHPTVGPSTCATGCSASTLRPSAGIRTGRSRRWWRCGRSVTLRHGSPPAGPDLQRRPPRLCPQSRHRRAACHRDHLAGRRAGRVPPAGPAVLGDSPALLGLTFRTTCWFGEMGCGPRTPRRSRSIPLGGGRPQGSGHEDRPQFAGCSANRPVKRFLRLAVRIFPEQSVQRCQARIQWRPTSVRFSALRPPDDEGSTRQRSVRGRRPSQGIGPCPIPRIVAPQGQ